MALTVVVRDDPGTNSACASLVVQNSHEASRDSAEGEAKCPQRPLYLETSGP